MKFTIKIQNITTLEILDLRGNQSRQKFMEGDAFHSRLVHGAE
jgi:hypothetical protein